VRLGTKLPLLAAEGAGEGAGDHRPVVGPSCDHGRVITGGAGSRPAWVPDEMATIGRENLDEGHVARYDDKEDARAAAEVAFLRSAGVGPAAGVVDLGAGTGQFALLAD
jgi:hypothetical protein